MKALKYLVGIVFLTAIIAGCSKNDFHNEVNFLNTSKAPDSLSLMFTITQDNSGSVTIIPSGNGAISYDVYFGDATATPTNIAAGKTINHVYAEGVYAVKIIGYSITGQTTTFTQQLTVTFRAPINLVTNISTNSLKLTLSASAQYETFFKVYFGDSASGQPTAAVSFLEGQTVTYTYQNPGTYKVRVIALSGGAATTEHDTTITLIKLLSLPVTFDDPSIVYALTDFGGATTVVGIDPTNPANHVAISSRPIGAATYAGTTIGPANGFANAVPLTYGGKITVSVYSPAVGIDVKFKLENHASAGQSVETDVLTTVANKWQTLTFDFSQPAPGTASFNPLYTYDKASIFFDFGNAGNGRVFYWDNVTYLNQINLPLTFEDATVDYTLSDFGGNSSTLTTDPTSSTNHVVKSIKTSGGATYAGTTMGSGSNGFINPVALTSSRSKITVMVYSPAVGIDIKLKVEDHTNGTHSVETDVLSTVANKWETLTFDFTKPASGTSPLNSGYTYDKASIFFDFGNVGDGRFYYWDNVIFP